MRYEVVAEDLIYPEEYDGHPDAVRAITQRYTSALERLIRTAPELSAIVPSCCTPDASMIKIAISAPTATTGAVFRTITRDDTPIGIFDGRHGQGNIDKRSVFSAAE